VNDDHVPNLLGDERPREHVASSPHQKGQQQELLRRQLEEPAAAGCAVPHQVDFEVGDARYRRLPHGAAAQQRADAREQLGEGERLHYVIVSAELQPFNAVVHGIARRQEQNRRRYAVPPQIGHDGPSITDRPKRAHQSRPRSPFRHRKV